MMLRWLEDACDLLVRRFSAAGAATRCYSQPEFAALIEQLLATGEFRLRRRGKAEVVLLAPGSRLCDVRKSVPQLRYRLRRDEDGRLQVTVFEHFLCFAKSKQGEAMRTLCEQRLAAFLTLLDESSASPSAELPRTSSE